MYRKVRGINWPADVTVIDSSDATEYVVNMIEARKYAKP